MGSGAQDREGRNKKRRLIKTDWSATVSVAVTCKRGRLRSSTQGVQPSRLQSRASEDACAPARKACNRLGCSHVQARTLALQHARRATVSVPVTCKRGRLRSI